MRYIILILICVFLLLGCTSNKQIPATSIISTPVDNDYTIQKNYRYEKMKSSCVVIHCGLFMGSGFIIYEDKDFSYIITDNHVIKGAFYVLVGIPSESNGVGITGDLYNADILCWNKNKDLALLRVKRIIGAHVVHVEYKNFPSMLSTVYCLGFPLDETLMITKGVISRYCMFNNRLTIQIDAATYCGGSGGPIFNEEGKVIGVTDAIMVGDNKNDIANFNLITSSYEIKKFLEHTQFEFVLKEQK